jgi:hypothetical protein
MGGADCELLGNGWLAQPVNAWSSLAYLVAAGWVVGRRRDVTALLGAAALALVAVGSFGYHGPQPGWAEAVHDASIVLLGAAVLVHVGRPGRLSAAGRGAVAAVVVGGVLYVLGRTGGPLCAPDSLLQLHAGWHVATAVAAALALGGRVWRRAQSPLP